jgi:hypothetical protein
MGKPMGKSMELSEYGEGEVGICLGVRLYRSRRADRVKQTRAGVRAERSRAAGWGTAESKWENA